MPTLATASPRYRSAMDLVKFFEGSNKVRTKAYLDSEGIPTIGWGATSYQDGKPVRMGDTVTPKQADVLLQFHMNRVTAPLSSLPNWGSFSKQQQEALKSFAYNAGPNFLSSPNFQTIANAVKSGDTKAISNAFGLYTNGGNAGLTTRRQAERTLFDTPVKMSPIFQQPDPNKPSPIFDTKKMGTKGKPNASKDKPVFQEDKGKKAMDERIAKAVAYLTGQYNPWTNQGQIYNPSTKINSNVNWNDTMKVGNAWKVGFNPSISIF